MWAARTAVQRAQAMVVSSDFGIAATLHPAIVQTRHYPTVVAYRFSSSSLSSTSQTRMQVTLDRYYKNGARLYARRLLELMAAAAASKVMQTQLQEAIHKPPSQWADWERKDWTDDLLQSLGRTSIERWWMAGCRLASLAALASPLVLLYPLTLVSDTAHKLAWDYALWGIEQAGPTFIKLTQWATTRQDMFSQEFCAHFGKLQDETRGHSWKETDAILKRELGDNYTDLLQIAKVPIGSGCIAQVYRGTLLKPTKAHAQGTEVALKVQHPGIWHKVCVDFYIMGKVAHFFETLPVLNLSYLSLRDTVQQFCNIMLPQLDLTEEAAHLKRFNVDFSNDDAVSFPVPLHDLTTPHVLTETFCHGVPILSYTNAPAAQRKELATLGLQTTLKMIFLHDFVHGDLHPGNILVEESPTTGKLKLHLLDCGLVVEMGPQQHINLVRILGAFARKNGTLAGQLMVDMSSRVQASKLDVDLFVAGMEQIVKEDEDNNFIEKVGDYIADICYLACKHKVKLEASFINAALAVEIMEGIATSLYNDMHVQRMALPMVIKAEMMHRLPSFKLSL